MNRDEILHRVKEALARNGFHYQDFSDTNSCFDLIARKSENVLVLKVLSNIDALRPEHARDLKKMAIVFHGHSMIVGEKSKVFTLDEHVLYDRYHLPVLSLSGFDRSLQSKFPTQRAYKGQRVVELDAQRLKSERSARELTLKELSERAGVSMESLHRYETGAPALADVAQKLEKILHTRLVQHINVFESAPITVEEINQPVSPAVLEQLEAIGMKFSVFERAPLTAAAMEQDLLVTHVTHAHHLKRKAGYLAQATAITHVPGVLISSEEKATHAEGIPVVSESELSTFSTAKDMIQTLHERRKHKNETKH